MRFACWLLGAVAVAYAFVAGLHTLQDFDLGWQLASGRWVVEHHHVFSSDVFSYTAAGQPWIYPALSGVVFYVVYLMGGFALLSWFGALTTAGTIALLLRRKSLAQSALCVFAVPLIANRTQVRAEMFTAILFAAFLTLLWRHYRGQRSALWMLPTLMVLWVNLHLGFVSGLGLCVAYVALELLDLPFPSRREAVIAHLNKAWKWLALTAIATLANPWGPSLYLALLRQSRAQNLHSAWVVEWENIHPGWASLHQALDWRDPQSSFWWLMLAALIGACIAAWRKSPGPALLLLGSAYVTFQHVRMQALFACVVIVVAGAMIEDLAHPLAADGLKTTPPETPHSIQRWPVAIAVVTLVVTSLTAVRSWDLISNRYYLRSTQLSLFGTGLSWWFPEKAAAFIERGQLPTNLFNPYDLGGYLTWRLPKYPDYIDGRAIPFGPEIFFRAYDLSVEPPDSPAWQQEADARGIHTIIVPLSRYAGTTLFPRLQDFCRSKTWRPVFLDEVSAVFVRRTQQTAALVDRLQIDCDKTALSVAPDVPATSTREKAEQFNTLANAGGIFYSLERYPEALAALDRAQAIFPESANVHFLRALVLEQSGLAPEAEAEFRTSLQLEPSDQTWFDLGLFYMAQRRFDDAADIFRRSAESSARPHEMWMMLGQADLQLHQPQAALQALDRAVAASPYGSEGESLGASFDSLVATGRAKAWYQLGDVAQAVSFQEEAVKFAPGDAKLWLGLADLYEAQGRTTLAAQARARAQELSSAQ